VIEGVVPAILTPFRNGAVDHPLLDEHLVWLAGNGIRCVNAMGTTGEGVSLSLQERKALVERVAAGPLDFVAGTGCTNLPETIELSRHALGHGALAALIVPPTYYAPQDLAGWYTAIFEALPGDGRVFLYHIPRMSHPIPDELVDRLLDRFGPLLAGIKDSSGDLEHALGWLRAYPGLTIAAGDDALAADWFGGGGQAMITAVSNVLPGELGSIRTGDSAAQEFVTAVKELCLTVPREAALKLLLHLVSGIPRADVRPPLAELTPEQERTVAGAFAELRSQSHVGSR
jgi:4-hydroxy-tetrahydrodipicolinate synthase